MSTPEPTPPQKDTTKVAQEALPVGQSASFDNGLIITVTNARHIKRDPRALGAQPEQGEVWTLVDFTVENKR